MSKRAQFISDSETFERYWHVVERTFEPTRRLPQQVFRKGFGQFIYCAFHLPMSPDFWPVLQRSVFARSDDSVLTMVLDPDPVTGFGQPPGSYAAFTLPIQASPVRYTDAIWTIVGTDIAETGTRSTSIPGGRSGHNMMILAETVVWVPESLEWALWAQRSEEIGVLGFNATTRISRPEFDQDWLNIDWAVGLASMTDREDEVRAKWEAEFRANYAPVLL